MSVLDGPGEGTWSVFAAKVVEERDALKEENDTLREELELLRRSNAGLIKQYQDEITKSDRLRKEVRAYRDGGTLAYKECREEVKCSTKLSTTSRISSFVRTMRSKS